LLESDAVVRELAAQVAALAKQGHEILIVHGGGRIFTGTLKRLGIESNSSMVSRVTIAKRATSLSMVFAGLLNKQLSAAISAAGQPAIGISRRRRASLSRRTAGSQNEVCRRPRFCRLPHRNEHVTHRIALAH